MKDDAFFSPKRAKETVEAYEHCLGDAVALLHDDDVTDFYKNPHSDQIIAKFLSKGKVLTEYSQSDRLAEEFCSIVIAAYNEEFSERYPTFSKPLPYNGSRITAIRPPATPIGVGWIIRRHQKKVIPLGEYLISGIMPRQKTLEDIRTIIGENRNILIAGPQGAGKTTLMNSVLAEIGRVTKHRDRWVIIEDTDELRIEEPDYLKLTVNAPSSRLTSEAWHDVLALSLRTSSDRIVIGELRFGATPFLDALATGHPGATTTHGSTPAEAMRRIESLLRREGTGIDRVEIAQAIPVVIVINKVGTSGRIIRHVVRVSNPTSDGYLFSPVN